MELFDRRRTPPVNGPNVSALRCDVRAMAQDPAARNELPGMLTMTEWLRVLLTNSQQGIALGNSGARSNPVTFLGCASRPNPQH